MTKSNSWRRRWDGTGNAARGTSAVARRSPVRPWARLAGIGLVPLMAACELLERAEPPVPDEADVAAYFHDHPAVQEVQLRGNVAEIAVVQEYEQLRRGGSLWAKVGPYIYLFSPAARKLLGEQPGVAALRVVTRTADGREVARATLMRDALSDFRWRRAQNLLGHALHEGTQRPRRLEQLVDWGEQHTEYEYSEAFVSNSR